MLDAVNCNDKPLPQNFPISEKISFLHDCVARDCHLLPLHRLLFTPGGEPVCDCSKGMDCTAKGKHPLGKWSNPLDPKDSRVKRFIEELLFYYPDRGFGIHVGLSRLCVLDIDPKNGGDESLAELQRDGIFDGLQPTVFTGSGGRHFYFPDDDDCDPRRGWEGPGGDFKCALQISPGVEWFSGQHFVVLPYSPHKSGNFNKKGNW